MFKVDDRRMKHRNVEFYVKELSTLFNEPIDYFRRDETIAKGYRRVGRKPSSK
jgi:hypothetical protein